MYVAKNIKKHYGGVRALDGVDLEIRPAEVHALLGANGAGKSTMVKVLVGAVQPTAGNLELNGEGVEFQSVSEAADRGIAIVSQELNLFPDLDVLDNLFLLREPLRGGLLLDRREMLRRAEPIMQAIGLDAALDRKLGTLRLGEQQLVEIGRALLEDPKILILDEPTSALQASETTRLLDVVRRLRSRGVGIVYVSHFLEDVFAIADTITVFRNGKTVARQRREDMTIAEAVRQMLGEEQARAPRLAGVANRSDQPANSAPLRLDEVSVPHQLQPTTLEALPGEVLGLAGLDGSGAHSVLDVVFGRSKVSSGTVVLPSGGKQPTSMNAAVRAGVAYVPADRKKLGVMLEKPIYENIATVSAGPLRRMGLMLRRSRLVERAQYWCETLRIASSSPAVPVGELSGGNQQKVVFAKWLEANPRVVLLDDPSRGVDVGARAEMHAIVAQMRERKQIVLYTSSDLEEMAEICDRVLVFFHGRVCGELSGEQLSEHRLLESINTGVVSPAAASAA